MPQLLEQVLVTSQNYTSSRLPSTPHSKATPFYKPNPNITIAKLTVLLIICLLMQLCQDQQHNYPNQAAWPAGHIFLGHRSGHPSGGSSAELGRRPDVATIPCSSPLSFDHILQDGTWIWTYNHNKNTATIHAESMIDGLGFDYKAKYIQSMGNWKKHEKKGYVLDYPEAHSIPFQNH